MELTLPMPIQLPASEAEPLTLCKCCLEYAELGREGFAKKHGQVFLLGPNSPFTEMMNPSSTAEIAVGEDDALFHPRLSHHVYSVLPSGRTAFTYVTVGRTQNNDIVLADSTVSKFHAFFRKNAYGEYLLQDAGSKNGTFLDGQPVPGRDAGKGQLVSEKARLRFGTVEFWFLGLDEFLTIMTHIVRKH